MKKIITTAMLCATLLLTGCSGKEENITFDGSSVTLERAGITLSYPDSWETYNGDALYESMYDTYSSEYDSIEDMKAAFAEDGLSNYSAAYSENWQAMCLVTSQDMTPTEDEEEIPLEEYARTVHDSTIFDYLASGYKTGDDSSFSKETYGGKAGYLSHFEIYDNSGDEPVFNTGFSEFMFQIDMELYSIQVLYFSQDEKAEAISVIENMTAA